MKEKIIDTSSHNPVYVQIGDWLKKEIVSGALMQQTTLPSVRDIAKLLKVNPNTIVKAYRILITDNLVESKPGSGYKVIYKPNQLVPLKTGIIKNDFKQFLTQALSLGVTKEEIRELILEVLNA